MITPWSHLKAATGAVAVVPAVCTISLSAKPWLHMHFETNNTVATFCLYSIDGEKWMKFSKPYVKDTILAALFWCPEALILGIRVCLVTRCPIWQIHDR